MTTIFHITHVDNIANMVADGGLWSDSECRKQRIKGACIGYDHIKDRRMRRAIPLPPRGVLGDYVPFYFAPRSPMLYTIDRRNTDYKGGQEPVVHLVAQAEAVARFKPALHWLFTDGHAEISFSSFFSNLEDLSEVDWELMNSRFWNDTADDNDRKRRRQAEFLVHRFFPWELVEEIGVYSRTTLKLLNRALETGIHKPKTTLKPEWYY